LIQGWASVFLLLTPLSSHPSTSPSFAQASVSTLPCTQFNRVHHQLNTDQSAQTEPQAFPELMLRLGFLML
ncbi:hypothetical protein P7K49_023839, partial [Saguinus oedipus]